MNNLEAMTGEACNKAMAAAVARLKRIGWTPADIGENADALLQKLRAACKGVLDEAVKDFVDACKSGARGYAVPTFYASFVTAGVKAANDFDAEFKANTAAHFEREAILSDAADRWD